MAARLAKLPAVAATTQEPRIVQGLRCASGCRMGGYFLGNSGPPLFATQQDPPAVTAASQHLTRIHASSSTSARARGGTLCVPRAGARDQSARPGGRPRTYTSVGGRARHSQTCNGRAVDRRAQLGLLAHAARRLRRSGNPDTAPIPTPARPPMGHRGATRRGGGGGASYTACCMYIYTRDCRIF